ncbi:lipid-binding SYLF domain-containing protein [Candidatus Synechococcus calcipolaris G9]|uniref:Lipid-binding SYLF domain-containing protein n=1 Tax=Candidatus Synechococcus calcipolaris G9 TaxID=1497997 RepID=A0ABT6ETY2_9SYNE|nr:lipid-binding SYLF domain-containing protein [Candidatus Synechococcus calcipolaris]MDG2989371.1 lipid-binding SYLF domain-containing protein [Candidatus Synechococcus calcipolaris G9]
MFSNHSSSRILGLTTATAIALVATANPGEASDRRLTQRVESATYVLGQFTLNPSQRIPPEVVQKAEGIAIIPNVVQAGFLFGGRRGAGVLMVRNEAGDWSHPAFITLTGGSFGLQIGAQSSDVVLVFMDKATIMRSLHQSFRLGGNVSVAAGPVGGDAVNPSDPNPQVYSYTRNAGLFAGVALEGAKIDFDRNSSNTFYEKRNLTPTQIFENDPELPNPPVLNGLNNTLQRAAR